jgi:hypothetical protein
VELHTQTTAFREDRYCALYMHRAAQIPHLFSTRNSFEMGVITESASGGSTVIKANHNIFTFDDPSGETVTVHENDPFYLCSTPDPGFANTY